MRAIAGKLAAVRPASLLARARVCAAHTPGPQARSQLPAGAAAWACRGGGLLSRPQAHAAHGHGARLLHGTARAQQDTTGKGTGDEAAGAASTDADDDLGGHLENLDDDFEPDFESEMDDLHIDADGDLDLEAAGGDYADDLIDDTDGLSDNLAGFYEETIDTGMHGGNDALQARKATFAFNLEDELVNVLGPDPQVDFSKDANTSRFMDLLVASPFASMGQTVKGVHVEGIVTKADTRGYNVDCGLKFDVRVKRQRTPHQFDGMAAVSRAAGVEDDFKAGDSVEVVLKDLERTAHLQGDNKHSSIYIGLGDLASPSF